MLRRLLCGFQVTVMVGIGATIFDSTDAPRYEFNGGPSVRARQFIGVAFTLDRGARVDAVTVNVGTTDPTPEPLFAAFIRLTDGDALPSDRPGLPFADSAVVATGLVTPDARNDEEDKLVPFSSSFLVAPGAYAIILGAGLFGSPTTANGYTFRHGPLSQAGGRQITWWDSSCCGTGLPEWGEFFPPVGWYAEK